MKLLLVFTLTTSFLLPGAIRTLAAPERREKIAQGVSPGQSAASEAPSLLPQAVAKAEWPQQQKHPSKSKPQKAKVAEFADPQQKTLQQAYDAIEKNDFSVAYPLLRKYLAEKPDDAQAQFQLGFVCSKLAKEAEAEATYRRAVELDPKMAAAYQNLGALIVKSNPAEANKLLSTAAQLQPENVEVLFLLGISEEGMDRPERALEYFRRAARARPNDVNFRLTFARKSLALGRAAEAEPEFRAVVVMKPEIPEAQLGLADCLSAQGKSAEAVLTLRKYLALQPRDDAARVQLAWLLFETQKYDESAAELERAEKSGSATLAGLKLRTLLLIRLMRFDDAIVVARRVVEAEPADAEWRARLGRLYLEKRDFPAAERELLAALRLDAANSDALRDLVSVYYLGEKYEAALRRLDELARREPPAAGHWFLRGVCLDKLQRKPEALAAYEKFIELDQGRTADKDFQVRQRIKTLKHELERKR
jgi:Flp pilus assembly protein TadD